MPFLLSFLSLTGLIALFDLWRLPFLSVWWWAIIAAQVVRGMGTNAAVYAHRTNRQAPPMIVILDTLAAIFIWGTAAIQIYNWIR